MQSEPSQYAITRGVYKRVDGEWHKRCTGPAHDEVVYLPATAKYFSKRMSGEREGDFLSQCRLCQNWRRLKSPGSQRGQVPASLALPYYQEAVNRIGRAELSRRTGISTGIGLNPVLNGQRKFVRKSNLRKVMLELVSLRRKNEYRSNALLRDQDKRRANAKREALRAKMRDINLGSQEEHLARITVVKPPEPDKTWWLHNGRDWVPRFGEEMLGSDF